ncbi:nuclear transport factor 2 family protein [Kribbella sp. NPDC051718]|uniref:nuclear transport factor 2 family protein n=1 Tax=Kribbella sp. NPDC051718 TaxID=3155168 RepID=UPI0034339F43
MTIPTPPDPTAAEHAKHLPHSITTYLREADPAHRANAHDLLSAFTPDAVVVDEETTYTGHDEIHRWRETAATEYTYTVELTHVEKLDETHYVTTNHLEGNFPGGVVDLLYRFTLDPDSTLITHLEIAP